MQRPHNYAIVDEVDSILIDEARTPLIISGQGDKSTDLYEQADRFAKTLKITRIKEMDAKEEQDTVDGDYIVDEKARTATLTQAGVKKAEQYFHLENLMDSDNVTLLHHINQAIKARRRHDPGRGLCGQGRSGNHRRRVHRPSDVRPPVQRGPPPGHRGQGRRQGGAESKTLATITFQNYFRLYKKLSGMTGTAKTEETEFQQIYKLDVVEIPTNKPTIRTDLPRQRLQDRGRPNSTPLSRQIEECHERQQPVLVGTISIEKIRAPVQSAEEKGHRP